jgi:hypothetical protein
MTAAYAKTQGVPIPMVQIPTPNTVPLNNPVPVTPEPIKPPVTGSTP